jgi:lipopolysaccharide transport system ATP-binding protein
MATAIQVENLSKAYQIGQIGTGTLSKDLQRWWTTAILRKEDPFLKIGEKNDRAVKGGSDIVWSLKDINFEVQQGDALGIIGRNGAGKSTLLKVLSEITSPTTGKINIMGRVASLLEVGTGFHPELTGRENIFLNGAVLGMRKNEIQRKLDEMIDFSGVERYIDTPVKRYSSGMYVRLAFAVAAHLGNEILIVDEVLAVGDAEFQKKCLGKMGDISKGEGRTVLFVSHDMSAIKRLTNNVMILDKGTLKKIGPTNETLSAYIDTQRSTAIRYLITPEEEINKEVYFKSIELTTNDDEITSEFVINDKIKIRINIDKGNNFENLEKVSVLLVIQDHLRRKIFSCINNNITKTGNLDLVIDSNQLTRGAYSIHAILYRLGVKKFHEIEECCDFSVVDVGSEYDGLNTFDYGVMFGQYQWK